MFSGASEKFWKDWLVCYVISLICTLWWPVYDLFFRHFHTDLANIRWNLSWRTISSITQTKETWISRRKKTAKISLFIPGWYFQKIYIKLQFSKKYLSFNVWYNKKDSEHCMYLVIHFCLYYPFFLSQTLCSPSHFKHFLSFKLVL